MGGRETIPKWYINAMAIYGIRFTMLTRTAAWILIGGFILCKYPKSNSSKKASAQRDPAGVRSPIGFRFFSHEPMILISKCRLALTGAQSLN